MLDGGAQQRGVRVDVVASGLQVSRSRKGHDVTHDVTHVRDAGLAAADDPTVLALGACGAPFWAGLDGRRCREVP